MNEETEIQSENIILKSEGTYRFPVIDGLPEIPIDFYVNSEKYNAHLVKEEK